MVDVTPPAEVGCRRFSAVTGRGRPAPSTPDRRGRTGVMDAAGVRRTEWEGWELVAAGAADGSPTALLLPGAQCTAAFYADVLADPR